MFGAVPVIIGTIFVLLFAVEFFFFGGFGFMLYYGCRSLGY